MAGNIPQQMMLLQQQQQQQQHQKMNLTDQQRQTQSILHNYVLTTSQGIAPNSWQHQVLPQDRYQKVMSLFSSIALVSPAAASNVAAKYAMEIERPLWVNSPDRATWEQAVNQKLADLMRKRQANAPELQAQLAIDAARQAQAQQQHQLQQQQQHQMMMNQMVAARMGQPGQPGFPQMQNQMQMQTMPQQTPMGMNMMNPGMMQNRPDQRQFAMGMAQQRVPVADVAQLSPAERQQCNELVRQQLMTTPEPQKAQLRLLAQQQMNPTMRADYQAKNMDPLLFWFQRKALEHIKNQRAQQQQQQQQQRGLVGNFMSQGQMNPAMMNQLQQGGPDNQMMGANMEAIRNEHQKALLAQHNGQVVVPASTGPGRNATPGPMGGLPPQGLQPGPNQMPRPTQMHQAFGLQPQNVKLENSMTQQQLQQAQAQARAMANHSMPSQPGALSGLPATSQSPGMNALNAPLRQPPVTMGQAGGQPVNPGNPQVGAKLNPHFNHQNNTRPQPISGPMNNAAMTAGVGPLPDGSVEPVMKTWGQHQRPMMDNGPQSKPNQAPGMPGQLQTAPNPLAVANPAQRPGPPGQQQPQFDRAKLMAIFKTPPMKNQMDSMDIPPALFPLVLKTLQAHGINTNGLDVRKWSQLWEFLQNNRAPPLVINHLLNHQMQHFIAIWSQKMKEAPSSTPALSAPGQNAPANAQQHAGQINLPPGFVFPPDCHHVTPEEMEAARRKDPRLINCDDATCTGYILNFKRKQFAVKAWAAYNNNNNGNNAVPGAQRPPTAQGRPQQFMQPGSINPAGPRPTPQMQTPAQAHAQKPASAALSNTNTTVPTPEIANKIQRPAQPQQQPQQSQQPQQQQPQNRPNPSPVPVQAPAPKNPNNLKRPSPDDVSEGAAQPGAAMQRPNPQLNRPGAFQQLSDAQIAKLSPDQKAKYEAAMRRGNQTEQVARLRAFVAEQQRVMNSQVSVEVPMTPEEYQEAQRKIRGILDCINKIKQSLMGWWTATGDNERMAKFWRVRIKIQKQFHDPEKMTRLLPTLTISHPELDHHWAVMQEIVAEVLKHGHEKPAGQRPPQQLSAENLEKQTQALKNVQLQKPAAPKSGQPPPAPTTTQAPYQFGVHQSPAGQPEYLSEQRLTQDNLVMPARKKMKTTPTSAPKPAAGSSSPVVKVPSPVVSRKPEPAVMVPKFMCPDASCEMSTTGFQTEEALNAHREEEHIRPFENPGEFMRENMAAALGLDAQGHPKPPTKAVGQEAAPSMKTSLSRQGQTPISKADMAATPMSRDGSMRRQGSNNGGQMAAPVEEAWAQTTIDPSNLFAGLSSTLDAVTGNVMADFGAYRSVTPNDTPESTASKDSGISEPTSDITEGAALDIDLNWQPLESDLLLDMNSFNMNMESLEGLDANMFEQQFSLDEVPNDFSKPFVFDNSFYMMDPSV